MYVYIHIHVHIHKHIYIYICIYILYLVHGYDKSVLLNCPSYNSIQFNSIYFAFKCRSKQATNIAISKLAP